MRLQQDKVFLPTEDEAAYIEKNAGEDHLSSPRREISYWCQQQLEERVSTDSLISGSKDIDR